MLLLNKNEGATNTPHYEITHTNYIKTLHALQDLRDTAWHSAIKYRFDPALSRAHDEYLKTLNHILKQGTN